MKRDTILFGILIIIGSVAVSGFVIFAHRKFGPDVPLALAVSAAYGALGYFIVRRKSFLLLLAALPFTVLFAFAPFFLSGTHGALWDKMVPTVILLFLNVLAILDAWNIRRYHLSGVTLPNQHFIRYLVSRGALISLVYLYAPIKYYFLRVMYNNHTYLVMDML